MDRDFFLIFIMQTIFKTLGICNTLNLILYDWGLWSGVLHSPHFSYSWNSQGVLSPHINSKQNALCYAKYILKSKFQVFTPNFVNLKVWKETFALPCWDKYLVLFTQKGIFTHLSRFHSNQLPSTTALRWEIKKQINHTCPAQHHFLKLTWPLMTNTLPKKLNHTCKQS